MFPFAKICVLCKAMRSAKLCETRPSVMCLSLQKPPTKKIHYELFLSFYPTLTIVSSQTLWNVNLLMNLSTKLLWRHILHLMGISICSFLMSSYCWKFDCHWTLGHSAFALALSVWRGESALGRWFSVLMNILLDIFGSVSGPCTICYSRGVAGISLWIAVPTYFLAVRLAL